jgi:hypothetical protein
VHHHVEGVAAEHNERIRAIVCNDITPVVHVTRAYVSRVEGVLVGNAVKIVRAVGSYIHGHTLSAEATIGEVIAVHLIVAR